MATDRRIVLRGGSLVDGTGAPAVPGDVAVAGQRIAALGRVEPAEGDDVLDVSGLTVTPGFHDVHTHFDLTLLSEPDSLDGLCQGVTTYHIGQCGLGFAPASRATQAVFRDYMAAIAGDPDLPPWRSVAEYLDLLDDVATYNAVYLVPHGLVRVECAGMREGPVRAEELSRMCDLVAEGMDQGARGVSTGLGYFPGSEADVAEIAALCEVAAERGGVYVSHIRDYDDGLLRSIDEACEVGRRTGIAVHVSHLRLGGHFQGRAAEVLDRIEAARDQGVDVGFDCYPYRKGCTLMSSLVVPPCVYAGGIDAAVELLEDRLARSVIRGIVPGEDWDAVHISGVLSPENKRYEGMRLSDFAAEAGKDVVDACMDLLVAERFHVTVIGWPVLEEDLRAVLRHPQCCIGSDGIPMGGARHPRASGTFARFLGRYVRELGLVPLEEAVRKITSLPARRFGLTDRGILAEGMAADIAVFDAEAILDRATYEEPHRLADGVRHVLINGEFALRDGQPTGAHPGRALRR